MNPLFLIGGAVLFYLWYQSQGTTSTSSSSTSSVGTGTLPSDAVYVGYIGTGGTWQTMTGPAYVYFSATSKLYYAVQTPPTATQVSGGAAVFPQGLLAGTGTPTLPTGAGTSAGGSSSIISSGGVTTNSGNLANPATSLAGIYAAMVAAAQTDANYIAGNGLMSPYQWGFYVGYVDPTPPASGATWPPDPSDIFPSGTNLNTPISAQTYWAAVSPYLASKYGMSGLRGLGARIPQSVYFNHRYGGWAV